MLTIATGDPCPDFSLPNADGKHITLRDIKGRPFVLYFYPKDNTPGCTVEALDFTALLPEFETLGVAVFGVSPDSVERHCRFRDTKALKVELLSDESRSLIDALGLWVEKSTFGHKSMGVQRATILFDREARAVATWPKVAVRDHAAEVLKAAKDLL